MNGKEPAVLFKVIAVVSALAIGGGYVSWRSAEAEKANQRKSTERAKAKVENEEEEITLMVGSKNPAGSLITREMTQEEIDSNWRTASDFITPISPGDDSILPELEEVEAFPEQVLFPSSKIGILVMPKISKEKENAEEETKKLLPGSKSAPIELIEKFIEPEKSE